MSLFDRIAATLAPAASEEERKETRLEFEKISSGQLFAEDILRQHKQIEQLFTQARNASGQAAQAAVTELSLLLNGHAMAEEAVIYPEVSENSGKTHAGMAYEEHAMTKLQLAELQKLEPGSKQWIEKLDHIESAVQQHIHQEEGSWLPDVIRNASLETRQRMSFEYRNYFDRFDRG